MNEEVPGQSAKGGPWIVALLVILVVGGGLGLLFATGGGAGDRSAAATTRPAEPAPAAPATVAPSPTREPTPQAARTEEPVAPMDLEGARAGEERTSSIGMELCWIPPGSFLQGCPPEEQDWEKGGERDGPDDERPQRRVTIPRGFWMGKHEVTQGQYREVTGENPSHHEGSVRLPVDSVNWNDAVGFCEELTRREQSAGRLPTGWRYRLPSESEWEYAARAGTQGSHYGELDRIAWYDGNSDSRTHPVGEKLANAWGLHDVLGNLEEWCQDPWHRSYEGAPTDGSVWSEGGVGRVLRGGAWLGYAMEVRLGRRIGNGPAYRAKYYGFRVVLAPGRPG